jgi:hypothetical protein
MTKERYFQVLREENVPEDLIESLWIVASRNGERTPTITEQKMRESIKSLPGWKPAVDLRNIPPEGRVS